ncbi:MAG TPA: Ig-like domain-containing protein [Kofleriaceae bacterium]|nr:Ig-like domain-containing protein [Kofleriaceae bacterium]
MKRALASLLVAAMPLAGCLSLDDGQSEEQPEILDMVSAPTEEGVLPRGSYVVIPPQYAHLPESDTPASDITILPHARQIFYMNKIGGTFTPGTNNSSTNRSSIPQQTSTIAPWNVSQAGWDQVMSCVRAQFANFDVEITDIDPGDVPHVESVVAGSPGDVQLPNNVGGVSPFTSDCSVIPRAIVYTFAELYGTAYNTICEVVAQEVAHSFGLDHQYLCADPMTYLNGCGAKSFQNIDAQCGEFEPRVCACGQQTQNSITMLNARIGPATDAIAPTIDISSPADGATVAPGFTVSVAASDDVGVARVELWIDGTLVDTDTTEPFSFVTSAALGSGTRVIETRAYDSKNVGTSSISVTVDPNRDPNDPNDPNPNPNDPNDPSDPSGQRPSDLVGGCASSNGTTGAGLALLILFMVFAARRRRAHS